MNEGTVNRLCFAESQAQDLVAAASQLLHMFLPGYQPNQMQQSRRLVLLTLQVGYQSTALLSMSQFLTHCFAPDRFLALLYTSFSHSGMHVQAWQLYACT